jgi:phosphatidylserine/phosphatidylglycerophosphate/cardiolipin synthase-like enzyme
VTVTHADGFVMARSAFHHSINYRSVVLFGRAEAILDDVEKHARSKRSWSAAPWSLARGAAAERAGAEGDGRGSASRSRRRAPSTARERTAIDDAEDMTIDVRAAWFRSRLRGASPSGTSGRCLSFVLPPARSGSYPLRSGNVVRPLVDGVPAISPDLRGGRDARRRVWATIAFVDRDGPSCHDEPRYAVRRPDGAVARGLDVRVVFWREPELDPAPPGWEHFPGTPPSAIGSASVARDSSRAGIISRAAAIIRRAGSSDAGEVDEVAFVGGINIDRMSVVDRGHREPTHLEHYHDVYTELRGPAATDVHHNFVQRWERRDRTVTR